MVLGDSPYFGISLTDYAAHPAPELAHLFNHRTECNIGFAAGPSIKEVLHLLTQRSNPDRKPAALGRMAIRSAFGRHKQRVIRALAEAALYRNKTTIVMWSDEAELKPIKLARLGEAWSMSLELREGTPVFIRHVNQADLDVTRR